MISITEFSIKTKRTRSVNDDDKFFIVGHFHNFNGSVFGGISGYIEKDFIEKDFIKDCPIKGIYNISVKETFDNEEDYLLAKNNYDL